jgi:hypothetical protein
VRIDDFNAAGQMNVGCHIFRRSDLRLSAFFLA